MWEVVIESGGAGFLYKVEAPDIARASVKAWEMSESDMSLRMMMNAEITRIEKLEK